MLILQLNPLPFPLGTPWSDWLLFDGVSIEAFAMPNSPFIRVHAIVNGKSVTFSEPTPQECKTLGRLDRLREPGFQDASDRVEEVCEFHIKLNEADSRNRI